MKTTIRNILSLAFGLYFLLVGTGFNVVNYCCDLCEAEGIETVVAESCAAVHHHEESCCDHQSTDDMACSELQHHPDSCHLTRLSVEVSPIASVFELNTNLNFEIILFANIPNNILETLLSNKNIYSKLPPPDDILFLNGRDILAAKAVLII